MTTREYMALHLMAAHVDNCVDGDGGTYGYFQDRSAENAVRTADLLIKALNARPY